MNRRQAPLNSNLAKSRQAQRAELADKQRASDVRAVMSSAQGRRLVWDIVQSRCRAYAKSGRAFNEWAFNEGKREVGIDFANDVKAVCPEEWLQMLAEAEQSAREEQVQQEQDAQLAAQEHEP